MREILFRGKSTNGIGWIEGSLRITTIQPADDAPYKQYEIEDTTLGLFPNDFMCGICETVDSETVGQFTGLTDKNGKRIFVGDIVKADNGKQSSISVVKFGDYCPEMFYKMLDMLCPGKRHLLAFGFYAESIDKHEEMILFQSPCVEVIGNIHDNPDLLIRYGDKK